MKEKNISDAQQSMPRMVLAALVVASCWVFAGCSEQISTIEENQLKRRREPE